MGMGPGLGGEGALPPASPWQLERPMGVWVRGGPLGVSLDLASRLAVPLPLPHAPVCWGHSGTAGGAASEGA